jgi:hypothetical protein
MSIESKEERLRKESLQLGGIECSGVLSCSFEGMENWIGIVENTNGISSEFPRVIAAVSRQNFDSLVEIESNFELVSSRTKKNNETMNWKEKKKRYSNHLVFVG